MASIYLIERSLDSFIGVCSIAISLEEIISFQILQARENICFLNHSCYQIVIRSHLFYIFRANLLQLGIRAIPTPFSISQSESCAGKSKNRCLVNPLHTPGGGILEWLNSSWQKGSSHIHAGFRIEEIFDDARKSRHTMEENVEKKIQRLRRGGRTL